MNQSINKWVRNLSKYQKIIPDADTRGVLFKKVFLEISQNSQ